MSPEARLDALSRQGDASSHAAHLRELEGALRISELAWKTAVRVRARLPNSTQASEVESLRLRAEVARLALARARDPANTATPLDHMQWQLEQLRQELLEPTLRVERLSTRDRFFQQRIEDALFQLRDSSVQAAVPKPLRPKILGRSGLRSQAQASYNRIVDASSRRKRLSAASNRARPQRE